MFTITICGITCMYTHSHTHVHMCAGQWLTQPPESTTAALGTNTTFSCCGTGSVLWRINGIQVRDANQLSNFANAQVFVPLPRDSSSELIVTATRVTNATLEIICVVEPGFGMETPVSSNPVQLLVYGTSIIL